jgi:hypothetical protein
LIHDKGSGQPRFIGNYSFKDDHCRNFLRIHPGEGEHRHLSDIIEDTYYGPQQDWDPWLLAPDTPETVPGTVATEEDGESEGGINDVFFATPEWPALEWVQRIAWRYPTLEVVLDYQRESHELLGRVMFSGGRIYKQSHLTGPPAVEIIEYRDKLPVSARRIQPSGDRSAARGLLTVVQGGKGKND